MAVTAQVTALKRAMASLVEEIASDARAKRPLSEADRRMLKRELDGVLQMLDELRSRIAG